MTSTSHHHPFIALFFSSNGRKIDDPRTKREIEIKSFILAQKDRRSRRETRTLRRKRMRFVAPFPRVCLGRELFKGEMIKFYRENYLSLSCVPFRVQRARARNDTKKRKNNQSLNDALFINRTLFAKATLLPSAAAVKEEAAIVEDDVGVKSEARDLFKRFFACISSPKRFFFRGPETQEKRGKRRSFFSLF